MGLACVVRIQSENWISEMAKSEKSGDAKPRVLVNNQDSRVAEESAAQIFQPAYISGFKNAHFGKEGERFFVVVLNCGTYFQKVH